MAILCILTNKFPYTTVEPYLETEVLHYKQFDKVILCSLIVKEKELHDIRDVPDNIEVVPVKINKLLYIIEGFRSFFRIDFWKEIKYLITNHKLNTQCIYSLLLFMGRAYADLNTIISLKGKELSSDSIIFYSYRFDYQPYLSLLLQNKIGKEKSIVVSRAHGYDLYEERRNHNYLPMRDIILKQIDEVYPCSLAGQEYLTKKYPKYTDKIKCKYLGTIDYGLNGSERDNNYFIIVSCSDMVKVKRLDKIVSSLTKINGINIKWIHFGSGPLEDEIMQLANQKLFGRVEYTFMGRKHNKDIMQFYRKNRVDLFINLSDSEGLPVSIMEAMSFGIPCLATDVGGTREIVENGINGFLVEYDLVDLEIARIIESFFSYEDRIIDMFRTSARKTWELKFDAKLNYERFVDDLHFLAN